MSWWWTGVYIIDCINYKVTNDIISINETLEHPWIEVQGKSKISPYLIGIVHQLKILKKWNRLKKI